MNRFASISARTLCYRGVGVAGRRALGPAYVNTKVESRYSTKASELKNELPKLWISKMRTAFAWLDWDGDGYLTEKDFEAWVNEMAVVYHTRILYRTRMVHTIRVRYIPYAYGTISCTIRVWSYHTRICAILLSANS